MENFLFFCRCPCNSRAEEDPGVVGRGPFRGLWEFCASHKDRSLISSVIKSHSFRVPGKARCPRQVSPIFPYASHGSRAAPTAARSVWDSAAANPEPSGTSKLSLACFLCVSYGSKSNDYSVKNSIVI